MTDPVLRARSGNAELGVLPRLASRHGLTAGAILGSIFGGAKR